MRSVKTGVEFWSKVSIAGSGCWEWRGAFAHFGHGKVTWLGRAVHAHRVAWELRHGPVPAGIIVRHKCDNPPCCNPDHLELGTLADNNADRVKRGRSRPSRGESTHNAKLTEDAVRHIRRNPLGRSNAELAMELGVSMATVSTAATGATWGHVDEPTRIAGADGRHWSARLSLVQVRAIRSSALNAAALARQFGVSPSTISRIRTGSSWKAHENLLRWPPSA